MKFCVGIANIFILGPLFDAILLSQQQING